MARSTNAIFADMLAEKQRQTALSSLNSSSATAIWRLMLYIVAYAAHVLEVLWDTYQQEVTNAIERMIPHRPKWYRDKVLAFMADKTLVPDTDRYDTTGMTDDEITAAQVVKHAVANESEQTSLLIVKVAGEQNGVRTPISSAHETQLAAYLHEIKDAGVRITLINQAADEFNCSVNVWYDATRDPVTLEYDCQQAITDYIENLPFNGEYSNMALIDALQAVEGVRIAEIVSATYTSSLTGTPVNIEGYVIPEAGYFKADTITINLNPYLL